jgi:hypothetical protein
MPPLQVVISTYCHTVHIPEAQLTWLHPLKAEVVEQWCQAWICSSADGLESDANELQRRKRSRHQLAHLKLTVGVGGVGPCKAISLDLAPDGLLIIQIQTVP